ncbi:hypothetical protein SUNI508_11293 [Seiridium unicorne]|uniref:CBM1 domain-containing protein n=1 Tax=Seiridium unicorne TaxID=138068 RepID=A0ABR2UIG6_9PEZI
MFWFAQEDEDENYVTVTPLVTTVTTTTSTTTLSSSTTFTATTTITTTSPSPHAKRGGVTATGMDGTITVKPTEVPDYVTYCGGYEQYYSACSGAEITAVTTTTEVSTSTITCFLSSIFTTYLGIPFPTMLIINPTPTSF